MDSTLIEAPSSAKNREKQRYPDAHQAKKGTTATSAARRTSGRIKNSGPAHSVKATAANVGNVAVTLRLLAGEEEIVYRDDDYFGAARREAAAVKKPPKQEDQGSDQPPPNANINRSLLSQGQLRHWEREKASVRAKIENASYLIKSVCNDLCIRMPAMCI